MRQLVLALLTATALTAAVRVEKTAYGGWPNCYRITNGDVELVVTADVGPRVIRFGLPGGVNVFKEFAAELGKSGESDWKSRGGHRLWVGPEDRVMTYEPDNFPVAVQLHANGLTAVTPIDKRTGLRKEMMVELAVTGSAVTVTHRIVNQNLLPVEFAAWCLTVMAPGGLGITGFPPRGTHPEMLAPSNPLVMWPFSDLSDPRWVFTKKYLVLKQDSKAASPQKLGTFHPQTFGAYLLGDVLFVKRYDAILGKPYPDMGASYETFTNAEMLELETLSPLERVPPGGTLTHIERWSLGKVTPPAKLTDAELDRLLSGR